MKIDENYRIDIDENNCTLVFFETRERTKKDGEKEDYEFTTEYHYPTIVTALKKYLDLKQRNANDVRDCIRVTEETYEKISKLQFNK